MRQQRDGNRIAPESALDLSLPRVERPKELNPETSETKAQLARLAEGLSSQLSLGSSRSALASQLSLETRLLGGRPSPVSLEKTTIETVSSPREELARAAEALKKLTK